MAADLDAIKTDASAAVADMKSKFLTAVSLDEHFISNYDSYIVPDDGLKNLQDEILISINTLDDFESILQNSLDNVLSYESPDLPDVLTDSIERDKEHIFYDSRLDQMATHLQSLYSGAVPNSGFSIDSGSILESIQHALYSYGYELDYSDAEVDIDTTARLWAADGYEAAPGALSFSVSETLAKLNRLRAERTSDVFSSLADTIQQNVQWAFENGISIEQLHMDFATKNTENKQKIIDTTVKAYIAEIDKRKDEMQASMQSISTIIKAARIDSSIDQEEVKLNLSKAIAELKEYTTASSVAMNGYSELKAQQIEFSKNVASGYGAIFNAYGSLFTGINVEEQSVEE